MAAVRSPNYPSMDLGSALEAIRSAYKAEHRNKMSREVLARHLGYSGLNGRALAKIGAVRAYGLIEGTQDELRVTSDAIDCLEAPMGSPAQTAALMRCATKPAIFQEINSEYPTTPSEHNLRYFLIKSGYTAEAASKASQSYLATMRLVQAGAGSYDAGSDQEAEPMQGQEAVASRQLTIAQQVTPLPGAVATSRAPHVPEAGMTQAVFPLAEGNVFLTFPETLTSDGYEELAEYLAIFLRRAGRTKRQQEIKEPDGTSQ